MKSYVSNAQHRERARGALKNQWGMMVWLTFLILLLQLLASEIVGNFFIGNSGGTGKTFANFLLENLVLFAIFYGYAYAGLQVLRGNKAKPIMLFSVFQEGNYVPMLIINFLQYLVSRIVNVIVMLPIFIIFGAQIYIDLMFNNVSPKRIQGAFEENLPFFFLLLIFVALVFLLAMFISGIFQFAVWLKFDEKSLTVSETLKGAVNLMKGRFLQYVRLQLSFIGWYIIGTLALFIGLLWVLPYQNVALASFYETAREEKETVI